MSYKAEANLKEQYSKVREESLAICSPLEIEDYAIQPCPEVSPPKWHLAHTTWFFEELILKPFKAGYKEYDSGFSFLFNSYYKAAGKHWLQCDRGNLSRPTLKEVRQYRQSIDDEVSQLLVDLKGDIPEDIFFTLELGLHHEQQHQELLLMDIKNILATNPKLPAYSEQKKPSSESYQESWEEYGEGLHEFGHSSHSFCYDNEKPRHKIYNQAFSISNTTVSNEEYLQFIEDGGYECPELWLSKGWDWVQSEKNPSPLYWSQKDKQWFEYTLYGQKPLDPKAVLTHINYFEADAFANWKKMRLPTEYELEHFFLKNKEEDDRSLLHPQSVSQKKNSVWCWSRSHYSPYPGYKKFAGMVEEYNGKFMCNQFVLKGGCVATPKDHYRPTYRNFYEPHQRWMFSGIRLAKDL